MLGCHHPDQEDAMSKDGNSKSQPTQAELSAKAEKMTDAESHSPLEDSDGPIAPTDPEADTGKAALEDTARKTAPSGALDHSGALPAQSRSGHRG